MALVAPLYVPHPVFLKSTDPLENPGNAGAGLDEGEEAVGEIGVFMPLSVGNIHLPSLFMDQ